MPSELKNLHLQNISLGRGEFSRAFGAEKLAFNLRKKLSKYVNNGLIAKLIYTPSCTHALNYAILGSQICGKEIVTTVTEHNSSLRPLYALAKRFDLTIRFANLNKDLYVDFKEITNLINSKTALVVINAVSNVTGNVNDYEKVGKYLKGQIPLIVDGAQAGGHLEFDMTNNYISALCLAPHKGFYGILGLGILALHKNYDISPIIFGGSGSDTFKLTPEFYPDKIEVGTINYPGIYALNFGFDYSVNNRIEHNTRLKMLSNRLIEGLLHFNDITIYSKPNCFGIVSFAFKNKSSTQITSILASDYHIYLRGGYFCAPKIHESLKTLDNGLIRASLSPFNTENEIDYFLECLKKVLNGL